MKLRKLLLILVILFSSKISLNAQWYYWWDDGHEIATDYNTCLQGVKDTLGNWVIQPQYEFLERDGGRYIAAAGGKYGLLNHYGKVLIPLQYEYLTNSDDWYSSSELYDCYFMTLHSKMGVVDTSNRVIVPAQYEMIRAYSDSSFVAKKSKRKYDFYNYAGMKFPCPWNTRSMPDHEADKAYVISRRTVFGKKYGMVDDSGNVILRRKYRNIYGYEETNVMEVHKGDKYGYCSSAGKWFWPLGFDTRHGYRNNIQGYVAEFGIGPAWVNGKAGLISIKGDVILPFEYDHISAFDDYYAPKIWEVRKGNLSGLYDQEKGWLLRPACSVMNNVLKMLNVKDSSVTTLIVANMNDKWGAMTSAGQTIIPFECNDMLQVSTSQYVFQKGDSLLSLSISSEHDRFSLMYKLNQELPVIFWYDGEYETMETSNIADNNIFSVFHGKDGTRAYYNPAATKDSAFIDSTGTNLLNGSWYGYKVPDTILVATSFAVIPVIKPEEDYAKFDLYGETDLFKGDSTPSYLQFVVMHEGNTSVMKDISARTYYKGSQYYITSDDDLLKSDGQILLSGDTISELESRYHYHDGKLYFRHSSYSPHLNACAYDTNGRIIRSKTNSLFFDFTEKYTWLEMPGGSYRQALLIDNKTGVNLLGKKVHSEESYPIWDSITIVETEKNGVRLFNIDRRKYFTAYGYDEIVPLNKEGTLFAVRTCNRNIGVVDASGKTILDTIYTTVTTVDQREYFWSTSQHRREFYSQFYNNIVFYNDTSSVMFQPRLVDCIKHSSAVPILWRMTTCIVPGDSLEYVLNDSLYRYYDHKMHVNLFMSQEDSAKMSVWQKQALMDSLYIPVRSLEDYMNSSSQNCAYCKKGKTWSYGRPWTNHRDEYYHYMISYRSDSLLCFSGFDVDPYAPRPSKYGFSTVMLFADGAHQMTLDSIFDPTTDWRNYVINTLINYVNSHLGIEGDCHNPAGIPSMLNETFELKPEGILLYPHGFEENSQPLVLTLPWSEADRYLRKDIKSRLPIPK